MRKLLIVVGSTALVVVGSWAWFNANSFGSSGGKAAKAASNDIAKPNPIAPGPSQPLMPERIETAPFVEPAQIKEYAWSHLPKSVIARGIKITRLVEVPPLVVLDAVAKNSENLPKIEDLVTQIETIDSRFRTQHLNITSRIQTELFASGKFETVEAIPNIDKDGKVKTLNGVAEVSGIPPPPQHPAQTVLMENFVEDGSLKTFSRIYRIEPGSYPDLDRLIDDRNRNRQTLVFELKKVLGL